MVSITKVRSQWIVRRVSTTETTIVRVAHRVRIVQLAPRAAMLFQTRRASEMEKEREREEVKLNIKN